MSDPAHFLFWGASSPWVYALADALARDGCPTLAIASYDALTYLRLKPGWPRGEPPVQLQREVWIFPPGYTGALAPLLTPLLRCQLTRTLTRLASCTGEHPWVITPYPWFGPALVNVPVGRLIYFHYDDYRLFRPERADRILRQERDLLGQATLTLCSSQQQTETLRALCPEKAGAIRHFPHGVVGDLLNPDSPSVPTARTVGYVGNLIDRVDWRLVGEVADHMPDVEFVFVGVLEDARGGAPSGWERDRAQALARPNVRHAGSVAQADVGQQYWSFGVNWIPYVVDHVFNQACCPTKIMDGLASGRPIVSTDLPECRLYPEWISIARDASEIACLVRAMLSAQSDPAESDRAARQVDFARGHLWQRRARTLRQWLSAG